MDLRGLRYFVTVAEERHFGRAAARLHMSQPPLSRAIAQLEAELGTALLHRTPQGAELTESGTVLLGEARELLARADAIPGRVAAVTGPATITIGSLADTAQQVGTAVIDAFRARHPGVDVHVREADLSEPTTGLRAHLVDVAITRRPFVDSEIATELLRSDTVGVVMRADDPLAGRESVTLAELAQRSWFELPDDTDPVWRAFWNPPDVASPGGGERLILRTIGECLQAALWSGRVGLAPMGQPHPPELALVPVADQPASELVAAWDPARVTPLIRSFVTLAVQTCRR